VAAVYGVARYSLLRRHGTILDLKPAAP